jgi:hypothetical protein
MPSHSYDRCGHHEQRDWYGVLYPRGWDFDMKKEYLLIVASILLSPQAFAQYTSLNSGQPTSANCSVSGCAYNGLVTLSNSGVTAPSGGALILSGGGSSTTTQIKAGPSGTGAELLEISGGSYGISPQINITLPGGTWGSGTLINSAAPLTQNATFAGSNTSAAASFGAFLQQTDNSSCTNAAGGNGCVGFTENLIENGSSAVGWRGAGWFSFALYAVPGDASGQYYTSLTSKCGLYATGPANTSCWGGNDVASIGAGVTATFLVGREVDTTEASTAVVAYRMGQQIVDLTGPGTQGTIDDASLSLNNSYAPGSNIGFKVGLGIGRYGGFFPVATNGTLIEAQNNQGSSFTVANGIDWHLGNFTGNSWNDGHTVLKGNGEVVVAKIADPGTAPGAGSVKLTAEAGTNPGTCKIVVRAGTSPIATTLIDNIGGSC